MISDLNIYRAAKLLVERHGEEASDHAAGRAAELLEVRGRREGDSLN
jgi:hypothetical protein